MPEQDQLDWWAALNGQSTPDFLDAQAAEQARRAEQDALYGRRNQILGDIYSGATDYMGEPIMPGATGAAAQEAFAADALERASGRRFDSFQDVADARQTSGNNAMAALDPYSQSLREGAASDAARRTTNTQNLGSAFNSATQANAGLFQGLQGSAARSTAQDQQTLGNMNSSFAQSSARDAANVSQLGALNNSMRQLTPTSFDPTVQSNQRYVGMQEAAYGDFANWSSGANDISSDAGLVGQQQGVANAFGGWASGANDVHSNQQFVGMQMDNYNDLGGFASGARNISSDAGLVGQQRDVYSGFGDFASGARDVSSDAGLVGMQQGAYDDYGQFASGAMDLDSQAATATADAEALAAQKEALGEFRDRMDPKLTDAERFLYMQSRLAQEQSQRSVRDANYRELERRGMGGSTMALSNLNASSAEASNTRALQDLGANAKAVDRAEKALVNYGNMSSTIADQSFERDFNTKSAADRMAISNNQQRFAGVQGQANQANTMRSQDDQMRQFNSQQQMQGLQGAGMMANSMRASDDAMRQHNSQLEFEGTRAQGAMATNMRNADDAMLNSNANRQLAGLEGQGSMVNSMRASDDAMRMGNRDARLRGTEGMATQANALRSADDAINMFNSEQQGIQSRFQDTFRQSEQNSAWGRGTDMSDAQFRQSEGEDRRTGIATDAGLRSSEAQWGRDAETTRTGAQMNRDYVEGVDRVTGRDNEAMRDASADRRANAEFGLGTARLQRDIDADVIGARGAEFESNQEDRRARDAEAAARARQKDQQEFDSSFSQVGLLGYLGL